MVALIREMMGYLISSDTSMQRVFFLWGQPRSGKGTIMRVTTALVGKLTERNAGVFDPEDELLLKLDVTRGIFGYSVTGKVDVSGPAEESRL